MGYQLHGWHPKCTSPDIMGSSRLVILILLFTLTGRIPSAFGESPNGSQAGEIEVPDANPAENGSNAGQVNAIHNGTDPGAGGGTLGNLGPSKGSKESRDTANAVGKEGAWNSAQVEALYQDGKINKATRDEALMQMALTEMTAFQNAQKNSGASRPDFSSTSSPEPAVNSAPITTGGFNPISTTSNSPAAPLMRELASLDSAVAPIAAESAPVNSAQNIPVVVFNAPGNITENNSATVDLAAPAAGHGSNALTYDTSAKKVQPTDGTYNAPGTPAVVAANPNEEQAEETTALLLARAMMHDKLNDAKDAKNGKDEPKKNGSGVVAAGGSSAAPDAAMEMTSPSDSTSGLESKIDAFLDLGLTKAAKATSDLGRWFLEASGRKPKHSDLHPMTSANNKVILDSEAAWWGGSILALMMAAMAGVAAWLYRRATRAENKNRLLLFHDPKKQDYEIKLKKHNGKRIAILEIIDRASKKVVEQKELVAGSILFARYLPPHLVGKMDLANGLEHVKYMGGWEFEKTVDDVQILVHVYRAEESPKKAS